ncbi:MAG: hypothetical protein HY959_08855 [Ignavibacteriae bacterium]|nr:hypothetical protein [Ignavibacteriota bacterium]
MKTKVNGPQYSSPSFISGKLSPQVNDTKSSMVSALYWETVFFSDENASVIYGKIFVYK